MCSKFIFLFLGIFFLFEKYRINVLYKIIYYYVKVYVFIIIIFYGIEDFYSDYLHIVVHARTSYNSQVTELVTWFRDFQEKDYTVYPRAQEPNILYGIM